MSSLKAGVHYPGDLAAVRAWFPDDAACLDYLDWLRWPDGFRCTHFGCETGWRLPAGGWSCAGCRKRVRVLAGTIFQDTRTPLTVWFEAAWLMAVTKNGVSAASLQPLLGLGSYETAWAMCHKLRTAMGRTSKDLLSGDVEVDETFIGGVKTGGKRGRGAPGKAYVVIAVESTERGFGRPDRETTPAVEAYVSRAEADGVHLGYINASRGVWYRLTVPEPPDALATCMARQATKFALNPDGALNLNTVHGLRRRHAFPVELVPVLVDWLNAHRDELVGGRTYAGGLRKVEPKEMEGYLVPDIDGLRAWSTTHHQAQATA